jgi:lipoate-protein ligase A
MRLRLVESGPLSGVPALPGALNMGIDEALLGSVSSGDSPPALRLYAWSPPCVTVGYFQSMEAEVDLEACRRAGVDVVRRLTGGGAVFHDAELTYSLIVPIGHELAPDDILESYRLICAGISRGLGLLGLESAFEPINDISAGGKKISGNAQTRRQGCLLQHGTLLLDLDPERMFSLLRVPAEKLRGRMIEDVKARVTSLRSMLGREVPYEEAARALRSGFAEAWGAELEPAGLSEAEAARAGRLAAERFSRPEWNSRR